MVRLSLCRTAPMGYRAYECTNCQHTHRVYNSCGDRNCPQCQGARRCSWTDKAIELLHHGITYFQVVFTLPDKLSSLVLGNRRELYKLLFQAAWEALKQSIEDETELMPAAMMVLHTWNQHLGHHPHVHAVVPGSGPSRDKQSWINCRRTKGDELTPSMPLLVDYLRLSRNFRDSFLRGIKLLYKKNKLKIEDHDQFKQIIGKLEKINWAVYIQPPPTQATTPEQVIKYLARYLTGGPISDQRIITIKDDHVHFMARKGDEFKSRRQVPTKLLIVEFIRRWTIHILPKAFIKTRRFGAFSNKHRSNYKELCEQMQPTPKELLKERPESSQPTKEPSENQDEPATLECPKCQGTMVQVEHKLRPKLNDLFYGEDHPHWVEKLNSS